MKLTRTDNHIIVEGDFDTHVFEQNNAGLSQLIWHIINESYDKYGDNFFVLKGKGHKNMDDVSKIYFEQIESKDMPVEDNERDDNMFRDTMIALFLYFFLGFMIGLLLQVSLPQ